jgi:hypothetical protein
MAQIQLGCLQAALATGLTRFCLDTVHITPFFQLKM